MIARTDSELRLDVLLVEDNPGDARLIQEKLEDARLEGRLKRVETLEEATRILEEEEPDLVLLDLDLPDSHGLETLYRVTDRSPDVAVVVLTGNADVELAVRSLRKGAQDYLTKEDASPEVLSRSIRYARERKRVVADLERAERQLQILDENLEEVFYIWDFGAERPVLSYCSSAYERLWGRLVEKVKDDPLTFLEGIHPDDRERVRRNLDRKLRGERHEDYRIVKPGGEVRWIRDQSYPILDGEGEIRWAAGTAWDITDQKELEGELEQAAVELETERSRLRELFHAAPVFMATLEGPDHVFEMVNPAFRELVGDRSFIGREVREVLPELEGQGHLELLARVYRTGQSYRAGEHPIDLERGGRTERRFLNFIYQPRRRGGEVNGIIAIGVDVTVQVEARQEARSRRETLERILETTADGVMFAGPDGQFRYANPAAEEILGLEESDIASRSYRDPEWEICGPDGGPFPDENLPVARVLRTGEPVHGVEHGVSRPDGTRMVLSVNAAPIRIPGSDEHGVVASIRDVTKRRELENQLRYGALHDHLTGLPNRTLFQDRLEHAQERAARNGEAIGVLFLDLDRFKIVNDSLGHEVGDRLLEEVARRIQGAVRTEDTVARMGGDEFTVLLEEIQGGPSLREAAERVVEALVEPVELDGRMIPVDVSVGAALLREDDESWMDLVRRADHAMYLAKERPGRELALDTELDEDFTVVGTGGSVLEKESRLRAAVDEDRVETVYQPIVSLEDGAIRGVEALARWTDPDLGRVSPLEFIGLAEETGLILSLGENQLLRACRQGQEWIRAGLADEDFRIHVNLSARQLEDPEVVDRVRRALETTGFPPANLFLEVTESTAVQERESMGRLKELGLGLSVDDFGTEYSTLSQVRLLPLDEIKIDRSFIRDLPGADRDLAIVRAVHTLAEALGLTTVAEGIEDGDQLELLKELGCPLGQGYFLGSPGPPERVEEVLEARRPFPGGGS